MKKVVLTIILSIVLVSAWVLYLEYSNRRFVEDLSKTPIPISQPVDTTNTPIETENGKSDTEANPMPVASDDPIVDNIHVRREHTKASVHPQDEEGTPGLTEGESRVEGVKQNLDIEGVLALFGFTMEDYQWARETTSRILNNPDNYIWGGPGSGQSGFVSIMSQEDRKALAKASYILNPTEESRKWMEEVKRITPPRSIPPITEQERKGMKVIEFKGHKIYIPRTVANEIGIGE